MSILLYNPSNLPKLPNIDKAMVIGSGLNNYKEEFELQFGVGILYDKDGDGVVEDGEIDRIDLNRLYR